MALKQPLLFLLLSMSMMIHLSEGEKLSTDYYKSSCPSALDIIRNTIVDKQITSPTTAAGTVRLFFHDCFVGGCDASVLVSSNSFNKGERDADDNLSLPGDGFDAIVRAKTALELTCPGVVSCSDILAVAARDLITMVGGPFYNVPLGRKDSITAKVTDVKGNLPQPTMPMSDLIALFAKKGFSVRDMVALSGAHTIGFSHCSKFAHRIYNYSNTQSYDPSLNPRYAEGLQKACSTYHKDPSMSAFNDVMTPSKFDNMYFQNLPRGLGLLDSDHALIADDRSKGLVETYAANQTAFFEDFVQAIEKLGLYEVKTGNQGEVRKRCDAFNSLDTHN